MTLQQQAQKRTTESRAEALRLLTKALTECPQETKQKGIGGLRWWRDEVTDAKLVKKVGTINTVEDGGKCENVHSVEEDLMMSRMKAIEESIVGLHVGAAL